MIVIFLNSVEWGGVDVVVGRFAKYLSSRGTEFCIVEPEGGRLRRDLPESMFIRPDEVKSISKHATHIFVPSVAKLRDPEFPWESLAHARLLTWVVHPNDPFGRFFPFAGKMLKVFGYHAVGFLCRRFASHFELLNAVIAKLIKSNALIAMDGATRRSLKFFYPGLPADPVVVPIPSPVVSVSPIRKMGGGDLSIGYLGRMDSMKWSAIKPFILHTLVPLTGRKKISLHFVSEGARLSNLKELCVSRGIDLNCYGYLPNQQAREIVVSRTDLAVAMGTSALDLAGVGHPCVILDPSLGLFAPRQKRFRFVHESDDYTLGEYRDFPGYIEGAHCFRELLDEAFLESVSLRERNYVQRAHDPAVCFDALRNRIYGSALKVGDVAGDMQALERSFESAKSKPFAHLMGVNPERVY